MKRITATDMLKRYLVLGSSPPFKFRSNGKPSTVVLGEYQVTDSMLYRLLPNNRIVKMNNFNWSMLHNKILEVCDEPT